MKVFEAETNTINCAKYKGIAGMPMRPLYNLSQANLTVHPDYHERQAVQRIFCDFYRHKQERDNDGKLNTAIRMLLLLVFEAIAEIKLREAENPKEVATMSDKEPYILDGIVNEKRKKKVSHQGEQRLSTDVVNDF